jgi:hypothetical protein
MGYFGDKVLPCRTAKEEQVMSEPSAFRKELEASVDARPSRLNPFTAKRVAGG